MNEYFVEKKLFFYLGVTMFFLPSKDILFKKTYFNQLNFLLCILQTNTKQDIYPSASTTLKSALG